MICSKVSKRGSVEIPQHKKVAGLDLRLCYSWLYFVKETFPAVHDGGKTGQECHNLPMPPCGTGFCNIDPDFLKGDFAFLPPPAPIGSQG